LARENLDAIFLSTDFSGLQLRCHPGLWTHIIHKLVLKNTPEHPERQRATVAAASAASARTLISMKYENSYFFNHMV
jgi:hypothetical protein